MKAPLPERLQAYIGGFLEVQKDSMRRVYPGLPEDPWMDTSRIPGVGILERQWEAIAQEIQRIDPAAYKAESEPIARLGQWDVLFLRQRGYVNSAMSARLPITTSALESLPIVDTAAGLVYISRMRPKTHIQPHFGPTNVRVRCHLPIAVPEGDCGLRVGGEVRHWQAGKCLVFNDHLEHEAWNQSDGDRIVLICDLWNPHLTATEVTFLRELDRFADARSEDLAAYFSRVPPQAG